MIKLKPLVFSISDLAYIDEPMATKNFGNPHDHAVYKATEVDALLSEKDKEIESLKKELSNLKSEENLIGAPKSIVERICEMLPVGCYIITVTPPMTSSPEDIVEMIRKDVPAGTCLAIGRWDKTYSIEFTKETKNMNAKPISLKQLLGQENRRALPTWLRELAEDHKSNWQPNSKGGEPNHD